MRLGSIYLVVNDFTQSVDFYQKLLGVPALGADAGRFAQFRFGAHNIAIMNGHFDAENPDKIVRMGEDGGPMEDLRGRALAPNTHKFALNFSCEDLRAEHARIKELGITKHLSAIRYFCYTSPYYYFDLTDPDGNVIEITGIYRAEAGAAL